MKALIINGHIKWPQIAEGNLNKTIFEKSKQAFNEKGYETLETVIDNSYEIPKEIEKWVNADVILFHFPINWFGMPAKTKDYIGKVLMSGYGKILSSENNVAGIAYDLGFESPSYFTRLFKKVVGVTPVQYKKEAVK